MKPFGIIWYCSHSTYIIHVRVRFSAVFTASPAPDHLKDEEDDTNTLELEEGGKAGATSSTLHPGVS